MLSELEKNAILETTLAQIDMKYTVNGSNYVDEGSKDKVFILSAKESDELYTDNSSRNCRGHVWLRSSNADNNGEVASVYGNGTIASYAYSNPWMRVI